MPGIEIKKDEKTNVGEKVKTVDAYKPSDLVIKEIMIQKGFTYEQAKDFLINPPKPKA